LAASRRTRKTSRRKLPLTLATILAWADDHRARTGVWPTIRCGAVLANPNELWFNIDQCLRKGLRDLPGGDSLPRLLVRERGHRNNPKLRSGGGSARRSLGQYDASLVHGRRGLPGGDSIAKLLERRFRVRNMANSPRLTEEQILAWADEHRKRTSGWPAIKTGVIALSPNDTWAMIDDALPSRYRGLPGGSSILKLLGQYRGVRSLLNLPPLSVEQVLAWADEHHIRTGRWPTQNSGVVLAAPAEVWTGINNALKKGRRGLPGGDSLSALLARHRRKKRSIPGASYDGS